MNKLLKLLNEYEEVNQSWKIRQFTNKAKKLYRNGWSYDIAEVNIISKKFWFIKWLVNNDKIDIDKYYEFMTNENIDISNACWELDMDKEFYYELLMILAVQDNSLEFLISILK